MAMCRPENSHAPTASRPGHERHTGGRSWIRPEEAHADECLRAYYRKHAAECLTRIMLARRHDPFD